MNRKQLITLVILVVLIGGAGLVVYNQRASSWQSNPDAAGRKLMPDFPINDVAHIVIKHSTNELSLVKQEDLWRVKERHHYPANFTEIGNVLRKMWELKVVQTPKVGPSQFGRLELIAPDKGGTNTGTLVEFKDKTGKTLRSVLLGKKQNRESEGSSQFGGGGYPVGRYVLVQDASSTVALISDPLSDVEPKPDRWLNKDFFKVEKLRSISVTSTNATNSWKVFRETEGGELKLADQRESEEFDASKASSVGSALSYPSFDDIVSPEAKPEDTGMNQPLLATLETFDNFTYTVKVGKKTDDDHYHLNLSVEASPVKERTPGKDEKPEDKEKLDKEFKEKLQKFEEKLKQEKEYGKWTYLVSKWTIDPLLKERKDFMAEKKEDGKTDNAKPGEAEKIEFAPPLVPELKKNDAKAEEAKKIETAPPIPEVKKEETKPPQPETKTEPK